MKEWAILPDSDLAQKENWFDHQDDRYAALRLHLLIVKKEDRSKGRPGPIISEHPVSPNDTITLRHSYEKVLSNKLSITEAIRFTTSSRLMHGVTGKVQSELSGKAFGFSGKLGLDLSGAYESELLTSLSETLDQTQSFEFQESEQREQEIELKGFSQSRTARLRRIFWPHVWDVYLYSFDYLEITYRPKFLFWWQMRNTIKQVKPQVVKIPLFRIVFYEPQREVAVYYDSVPDELPDPAAIEIHTLGDPAPRCSIPSLESLESLAELAFPETRKERDAAEKRRQAKKKAVKKRAAKKKAAKKTAVKKTARKKTARKSVARKAAKKPARKKAAKKTRTKKASRKSSARRPAKR